MRRRNPILADLVLDSTLSLFDIADELGMTEQQVRKEIKESGLEWVGHKRGHASRGQYALYNIMRKLLPGEKILTEEPLGDRLRLDVYCPKYKLAVEYHGRQHFEYVEHFHSDYYGFQESLRRDERKLQLCKDLGIALVVVRYSDILTEEAICERLLEAIRNAEPMEEEKPKRSIKGNPYYEAWKQRQREYRKLSYQRMKKVSGRKY